MGFSRKKLAIDIGTSSTRIIVPKKGIVINEPTLVAQIENKGQRLNSKNLVAVGSAAAEMNGKQPAKISIIKPMKSGVIADFNAQSKMLGYFIKSATGRIHFSQPEAMITISATASSTEKKAMVDAAIESGLQNVHLIKSSIAAALGSGLQITKPTGSMIIDIGAGTTEIGVFSLGGIITESAIRVGGDNIDESIKAMARREHGVRLANSEIYKIKSKFLNLNSKENNSLGLTAQSIINGTPKKITIKQKQLINCIEPNLDSIASSIKSCLEQSPPDILSDISKNGVILSGGSCKIKGLSQYLTKRLNIAFIKATHPSSNTIKGANLALTHLDDYQKSLLS